ncbi:ABC transporter substrate-binding protein [Crossiella cryophila]|uniref:Osmoprotectant transport system substrate-binding protein n=1 Tax=Crossiella cryophila TaxID=43355 RepID=A0A7W7FRE2_9PSEU|nr:ABC transporter substrate-binding protein [Crossiella cryophila]MBB4675891.1 osmoprotectant transport system substrate-binding protein [Crossiella cryophila]
MKRNLAAVAVLVVAAVSACGAPADPLKNGAPVTDKTIHVGSVDFPENKLLAEIYAAVLDDAGAEVKVQSPVSAREVMLKGLKDGSFTLVPDYSGNLLQALDSSNTATKSEDIFAALKTKVGPDLEVLEPAPGEDKDVLVVTQQVAQQFGLKSLADLGPKCSQLTLAAAGEWKTRWEAKIKQLYGCTFKEIRSTDAGGPVTLDAIKSGTAQVANLFTTASAIGTNNFVQLADPKNMYPAQNIIPLFKSGKLTDAAKLALNQISKKITTEKLAAAVKRIEVDKENPVDVAADFVKQNA